jgi:hypothetical protein
LVKSVYFFKPVNLVKQQKEGKICTCRYRT